jgi:hypothetical protein
MGLKAANSNFPCIHCHCHKKNLHRMDVVYEKRSFEKQSNILSKTTPTANFHVPLIAQNEDEDDDFDAEDEDANGIHDSDLGYKNPPLMSIPYKDQLSDLLHMKNRITDVLFVCFLNSLSRLDNHFSTYDPKKHLHLKKFLEEVQTKCKMNIDPVGVSLNGIKNIFKSLTGDQRTLLIKEIKIKSLYGGVLENADRVEWLWSWFYQIMNYLSTHKTPVDPEKLKNRCQTWLKVFIEVYPNKHVTPYMHRFAMHLYEGYIDHKDVNLYNLQGFEKTNDILRQRYLRSSNRRKNYVRQILEKCLRVSHLEIALDFAFLSSPKRNA